MEEFRAKAVMLIVLLIGLTFIGIGLTLGFYYFPDPLNSPAIAGLPIPPDFEMLLILII